MANNTSKKTYYSVAETAVFVRQVLKQSFPCVKFSVKSRSYSGGASINIQWIDGPTSRAVEAVVGIYEGASFDGSIDLKSYHDAIVMDDDGPRHVHYGANYIFERRLYSVEFLTRIYQRVCRAYALTPRADAIRTTYCGDAELTDAAAFDVVYPGMQVRDAVSQMAAQCILRNGLLMELKRA